MNNPVSAPPARSLVLLAFAIIYIVWGSTYLAIRVVVETIPPFLSAATRFFVAGTLVQRAMGQDTITRMKLCSLKPPQHHIAPSIQRTGRSFLPPLGTFGDGSDWIFVVPAWRVEGMMTFEPRTALTEMAMEKRDGRAA